MRSDTDFVAVQPGFLGTNGQVIQSVGNLCWYTISETKITREDLQTAFGQVGLDEEFLPTPLNARDAFRRACTNNDGTKVALADGQSLIFMVREVLSNKDRIVRDVVRELRDGKNVTLKHLSTVRFILAGDTLSATALVPESDLMEQERAVADRIVADFAHFSTHYDSGHIRDLVARILNTCDPVNVRESGGVYFTPAAHETTVRQVKSLLVVLQAYNTTPRRKSKLAITPVIDAAEIDLQESLADQLNQTSDRLIQEMAGILKSGRKVRPDTASGYIQRVRDMGRMLTEYKTLLASDEIGAEAKVQAALQQAMSMMGQIE